MNEQNQELTDGLPPISWKRMALSFNKVASNVINVVTDEFKSSPAKIGFGAVAILALSLNIPLEQNIAAFSSLALIAGAGCKSNRDINASLSLGSAGVAVHMAMIGNIPGVLQSTIGAARTAFMNAADNQNYKLRTGSAIAAFGIAAGVYAGFSETMDQDDFLILAAMGCSAAGGALPVELSRYTRLLYATTTALTGTYFFIDQNPSPIIAGLQAFLCSRYIGSSIRNNDLNDFKKDFSLG